MDSGGIEGEWGETCRIYKLKARSLCIASRNGTLHPKVVQGHISESMILQAQAEKFSRWALTL